MWAATHEAPSLEGAHVPHLFFKLIAPAPAPARCLILPCSLWADCGGGDDLRAAHLCHQPRRALGDHQAQEERWVGWRAGGWVGGWAGGWAAGGQAGTLAGGRGGRQAGRINISADKASWQAPAIACVPCGCLDNAALPDVLAGEPGACFGGGGHSCWLPVPPRTAAPSRAPRPRHRPHQLGSCASSRGLGWGAVARFLGWSTCQGGRCARFVADLVYAWHRLGQQMAVLPTA